MKSNRSQVLPDGHRFPVSIGRLVLFAIFTCCLYAAGLGSGGWAATSSLAAARAGQSVPWAPWLMAFIFMVSGMLSVVYGFFFRPRAVEVNEEEVALVKWDGKGASLRRADFEAVESGFSRILVTGRSGRLAIPDIFADREDLVSRLKAWESASRADVD